MDADSLCALWQRSLGTEDLTTFAGSETYRPPPPPAGALAEGEAFTALDELGRGGMGIVYRARQTRLQREVALKRPRGDDGALVHEGLINGRLEHPNIIPVYDLGRAEDGRPFLAMKLIDGRSWKAALAEEGSLDEALEVLLQVCQAVAYAHRRGVLHLDIKPSNVMLGAFGEVLLTDWGLARAFGDGGQGLRRAEELRRPCGTPCYMPPELAEGRGDALGPATDTYLLGGVLFRLLCGRPPHRGRNLLEVLLESREGRVPTLPDEVPVALRRICCKALDPDPGRRYDDALALAGELRGFLRHRESLTLGVRAQQQLDEGRARDGEAAYGELADALGGFEQSLALWPGNADARAGREATRRAYAEAALAAGDLALAARQAALLDAGDAVLQGRIDARRRQRAEQTRLRRRLRFGLAGASLALGLALLFGTLFVAAQNRALSASRDSLAVQNSALRDAQEVLSAQKDALAREKFFSDRRGEVARTTLEALTDEVQQTLLYTLSDERSYQAGLRLLRTAADGWQELLDTSYEIASSSRGTARLQLRLAELHASLSLDFRVSRGHAEAALATLEELYRADSTDLLTRQDYGLAQAHIGAILVDAEEPERGLLLIEEGAARMEEVQREIGVVDNFTLALVNTLNRLGLRLGNLGEGERARDAFERALSWCERIAAESPSDPPLLLHRARARRGLAWLEGEAGLPQVEAALEEVRRIAEAFPESAYYQDELIDSLRDLGRPLQELGDHDRAAEVLGEALQRSRAMVALAPKAYRRREALATVLVALGTSLAARGETREARALFLDAAALAKTLSAEVPVHLLAAQLRAQAVLGVADSWYAEGAWERSLDPLLDARSLLLELIGRRPEHVPFQRDLSRCLNRLGTVCQRLGSLDQAAAWFRESLGILRELRGEGTLDELDEISVPLIALGGIELERGALDAADALYAEAHELLRASPASVARDYDLVLVQQSRADLAAQRAGERVLADDRALVEGSRALLALDPGSPPFSALLASHLRRLAHAHQAAGDFPAYRACLEEGLGHARVARAADYGSVSLLFEIQLFLVTLSDAALVAGELDVAAGHLAEVRETLAEVDLPGPWAARLRADVAELEEIRARMEAEE